MHLTRATYDTRAQKTRDFLVGFIGWFVANALLNSLLFGAQYALLMYSPTDDTSTYQTLQSVGGVVFLICNALVFLGNIGLMIYFALTRYWIALGMLGAFAGLTILTICAAVVIGGICFASLSGFGSSP